MWPSNEVLSDARRSLTRDDLHLVKRELVLLEGSCLLVQENTQEGGVDMETPFVPNEAQLSEFGHEKADPSASRANHFR